MSTSTPTAVTEDSVLAAFARFQGGRWTTSDIARALGYSPKDAVWDKTVATVRRVIKRLEKRGAVRATKLHNHYEQVTAEGIQREEARKQHYEQAVQLTKRLAAVMQDENLVVLTAVRAASTAEETLLEPVLTMGQLQRIVEALERAQQHPFLVADSKGVAVGAQCPILGWFPSEALAEGFINTLPEGASGRYQIDEICRSSEFVVDEHIKATVEEAAWGSEHLTGYDK